MGFLHHDKPLKDLPRFGDLSQADMRKVCDAGREVNVPEGWSLLIESTPPDQAYLVIEGRLQVVQHGKQIAELGRGDIVGEIGVTQHKLRNSSVTGLTPLVMLHLTKEAFNGLYKNLPSFRDAVEATMAARLGKQSAGDPVE